MPGGPVITAEVETLVKAERRDSEQELASQASPIFTKLEDSGAFELTLKTNKEYQAHLFEIELAEQEKRRA